MGGNAGQHDKTGMTRVIAHVTDKTWRNEIAVVLNISHLHVYFFGTHQRNAEINHLRVSPYV